MSGILEWHRKCVRYGEAELRRSRASAIHEGLGTSALRLPTRVPGLNTPKPRVPSASFEVPSGGAGVGLPNVPSGLTVAVPSTPGASGPTAPEPGVPTAGAPSVGVTAPSEGAPEPERPIGMPSGIGTSAMRVKAG
jgi:germacradienol/geosmin synthase